MTDRIKGCEPSIDYFQLTQLTFIFMNRIIPLLSLLFLDRSLLMSQEYIFSLIQTRYTELFCPLVTHLHTSSKISNLVDFGSTQTES